MPEHHPDEQSPSADQRLRAAYRRADYWVNGHLLKIDERHPDFDRALTEAGIRTYALITAHNPRSTVLSPEENGERHRQLLRRVAERRLQYLPARSSDPSSHWVEEIGICLLDVPTQLADHLAAHFQQHAIVTGERGGLPYLRWLS